jgi:hypothetical protein
MVSANEVSCAFRVAPKADVRLFFFVDINFRTPYYPAFARDSSPASRGCLLPRLMFQCLRQESRTNKLNHEPFR